MDLENIILDVSNSPKGYLIKNKQFINYLTKSINIIYGVRGKELIYPAPQPVSIETKDFSKLKQYKYYTSLKLDGIRFLLYFLKDRNNKNQAIIINRALNFYIIELNAEDTIYNGTLLDGELIYNKSSQIWEFMVHDALMLCGNRINKFQHSLRLGDTKYCLDSFVNYTNNSAFNLKVKEFYSFDQFDYFIDEIYNKSDNNDGLIFMPENLPVISGTQYSMLKWKPHDKHTFDFLIKECDEGMEAYVFYMGNMNIFAKIYKNTEEGLKFINLASGLNNYKNDCIVECYFNREKSNFTPFLVRTDKTHPNSLRTIERTLFNITEDIQIDDFKKIVEELNKNNE
tara:strand:+ start:316 stop:1341 length:1026 start_codon:yes stop_codon:yes gene_type:complete